MEHSEWSVLPFPAQFLAIYEKQWTRQILRDEAFKNGLSVRSCTNFQLRNGRRIKPTHERSFVHKFLISDSPKKTRPENYTIVAKGQWGQQERWRKCRVWRPECPGSTQTAGVQAEPLCKQSSTVTVKCATTSCSDSCGHSLKLVASFFSVRFKYAQQSESRHMRLSVPEASPAQSSAQPPSPASIWYSGNHWKRHYLCQQPALGEEECPWQTRVLISLLHRHNVNVHFYVYIF